MYRSYFFWLQFSVEHLQFAIPSRRDRNMILMPVLLSCSSQNISIDRFMSFERIESAYFDKCEMRTTGFLSLSFTVSECARI